MNPAACSHSCQRQSHLCLWLYGTCRGSGTFQTPFLHMPFSSHPCPYLSLHPHKPPFSAVCMDVGQLPCWQSLSWLKHKRQAASLINRSAYLCILCIHHYGVMVGWLVCGSGPKGGLCGQKNECTCTCNWQLLL